MKPTNTPKRALLAYYRRVKHRVGHGTCPICQRGCWSRRYLYKFTFRSLPGQPSTKLCYRCWRLAVFFQGDPRTVALFASRFGTLQKAFALAAEGGVEFEAAPVDGGKFLQAIDARPIRGPKLSRRRQELERARAVAALKALAGPTSESEAALS